MVDAVDLNIVALNWQMFVAGGPGDGDFNGDGFVDAADLNELALNWQVGVNQMTLLEANPGAFPGVIPEPGSAAGFLAGLIAAMTRRRQQSRYSR